MFLGLYGFTYANTLNSSASVASIPSTTMPKMQTLEIIKPSDLHINHIDSNADDLIQIKRKLEVEKAEAELKKIRNSGSTTSNGTSVSENAQTTVTGVAINQEGKKIGWLQFADGSSLTVNIGSQVGKYTVTDITMTGVQLSAWTGKHKRQQNVFLKRAYYVAEKSKKGNNPFLVPSPTTTFANSASNDSVPPIVPIR